MVERGYGRVLFTSSIAGLTGGIVGPHYAATKAALHGLTHHLASRVARDGVTVNALAPALIEDTNMLPGDPGELAARIPAGRLGTPHEVADLALAMLRNGYLTSKVIALDGGLYADLEAASIRGGRCGAAEAVRARGLGMHDKLARLRVVEPAPVLVVPQLDVDGRPRDEVGVGLDDPRVAVAAAGDVHHPAKIRLLVDRDVVVARRQVAREPYHCPHDVVRCVLLLVHGEDDRGVREARMRRRVRRRRQTCCEERRRRESAKAPPPAASTTTITTIGTIGAPPPPRLTPCTFATASTAACAVRP